MLAFGMPVACVLARPVLVLCVPRSLRVARYCCNQALRVSLCVQEQQEEDQEGARKRRAVHSPARDKSPAGSKSPAKPRSGKKSKLGGKIMTEANRTAAPLSTADEFYVLSACFGEVHGKVPVEQELAKVTERAEKARHGRAASTPSEEEFGSEAHWARLCAEVVARAHAHLGGAMQAADRRAVEAVVEKWG